VGKSAIRAALLPLKMGCEGDNLAHTRGSVVGRTRFLDGTSIEGKGTGVGPES